MSDVSPYGTHQHAAAEAVHAHALVGERIDHLTVNQVGGASPAAFSTAPFKGGPKLKPRTRLTPHERDRLGRCVGKEGTCKVRPIHGMDVCWFHMKQRQRRGSAATS